MNSFSGLSSSLPITDLAELFWNLFPPLPGKRIKRKVCTRLIAASQVRRGSFAIWNNFWRNGPCTRCLMNCGLERNWNWNINFNEDAHELVWPSELMTTKHGLQSGIFDKGSIRTPQATCTPQGLKSARSENLFLHWYSDFHFVFSYSI